MKTEANLTLCKQVDSIPTFTAIFATDGDSAEIITDILTNTDNNCNFFCIIHNCYSYNITVSDIFLVLALPVKRPGCCAKCLPVFQVRLPWHKALTFLLQGAPLSASDIQSTVNHKATRKYYKPILDVLMCSKANTQLSHHEDIKSIIYWFRAKFVITLRKLFRIAPSPFWMITTFGTFEATFVLVASLYFFENHACTIETLTHLSFLFSKSKGQSLANIANFFELGSMFGNSEFLPAVPEFKKYVNLKLERDHLESKAIDSCINSFRGKLMLSNQDLIHYIYLSFFQCLGKKNFLEYSLQTNSLHISTVQSTPILTKFIDDSFKDKMSTYYNKNTYLSNHISIKYVYLSNVKGYSYVSTSNTSNFQFWSGLSREVQKLIKSINKESPYLLLNEELQGLLDLAATGPDDVRSICKSDIFSEVLVNPVYRCQFLNKNFFVLVNQEIISEYWKKMIILPHEPNWETSLTDMQITERICYKEAFFTCNAIKDQLQLSRHEYFNSRLPVFNLVLDLDLPLQVRGLSLQKIYSLCLTIRDDLLQVLQLLGNVEPNEHPVYFFKSACPPIEWDIEGELFCHCNEKLGLRIITPLPKGTAIVGSEPLVELVKILNRIVKMNPIFLELSPNILDNDGPFDTGIYYRGRCVRIPHTYKVNTSGVLERLLKIIVCHPNSQDKTEYVYNALNIKHLLHHSNSSDSNQATTKLISNIKDISEHFLIQKAKEQLPLSLTTIDDEIEKVTGVNFIEWFSQTLWPKIHQNIKAHFPDEKTPQFQNVKFVPTSHNIIQIKPCRGSNFVCISHNHKNKTQGVRIYVVLYTHQTSYVIATLMSQCFASKCNNNKPKAHLSLRIPLRSTIEGI
ncbi:ORF56 [Felid gammaherpesvirus 1]|uniref:ORF56 n=1 Tax=Felid gammaherpesvirus 1 TaxID=2560468 RepID=A0A0M4MS63_9GAMA|nr:ORF56 [Felis catus gammaherpesvirus 1]ALE14770.1 ORF56 [Felis catus gammaherpesvirus 1]